MRRLADEKRMNQGGNGMTTTRTADIARPDDRPEDGRTSLSGPGLLRWPRRPSTTPRATTPVITVAHSAPDLSRGGSISLSHPFSTPAPQPSKPHLPPHIFALFFFLFSSSSKSQLSSHDLHLVNPRCRVAISLLRNSSEEYHPLDIGNFSSASRQYFRGPR